MNLIKELTEAKDPRLEYLWTAVSIAQHAGTMIREAFVKNKGIMTKACSTDLVTETDQNVEKYILKTVKERFPEHCFIGEESVADGASCALTDTPTWIVDPLDGTTNFVHRFPYVAVSIGIAIDKEIEVAVVYGCIIDQLYVAVRGHGSYCGHERLSVSKQTDLSSSLILSEWGSDRTDERIRTVANNMAKVVARPIGPSHGIRSMGSAALNMALVASGSADVYYEWGIHCWDIAAGKLLIEEAGGIVASTRGEKLDLMGRNIICASSKEIVEQVSKEVTQLDVGRD